MSFSFGSTSVAQPAASSGFSFGAAPAAATPVASSGFSFGATAPAAAAAPAPSSGFSFGATTTPAPATSGGFSFGSSTGGTTAPAAASSGFSFGASTTSTAARSLFGSTPTPAAPATSGGFFSAPAATTTTPSLFGGASGTTSAFGAAPAAPSATSSFFGAPAAAAAPASTGGFFSLPASTPAAPASTGFGFFGAPAAAAAAPAPPNGQGITLETPFEALPADVQKNIVAFHKVLKGEDQSDAFLKTVSPRKLDDLRANIAQLAQDVLVRRNVQDRQATAVHHVRKDVKQLIHQVDAATLSMRTLDGTNAASNLYSILRHVETPSPYYWDLLDHFERSMSAIKAQIEDIEAQATALADRPSAASAAPVTPAHVHAILVSQNASLMHVAARVAEVHEQAEALRQLFLETMRADLARHGEFSPAAMANPFDKRKKSSAQYDDKRETIDKIRFRTSVAPTIVAPAAAPAAATPQLGLSTSFTGFGTTAPTPAATTPSIFGAPAPAASTSGFSFGATAASTAPKQVTFNLGGAAPTTATTAAPTSTTTMSSFAVPTVTTTTAAAPASAFGSVASSFLPSATTGDAEKRAASSKRLSGRPKKRA